GNSLAMEENLELALQKIFGGGPVGEKPAAKPAVASAPADRAPAESAAAGEALTHYRKAQEFLRQGNWAGFGQELQKLEDVLKGMEKKK
ncbi:MAG TPA: hypothetical protein VLS90_17715, partial [Thermodesulfobacteriota bacterium]|nr:hypothetical protein [Thermodesulfobacteriota bacterium]